MEPEQKLQVVTADCMYSSNKKAASGTAVLIATKED
jgi:hypothetical protein